MLPLDLSFWISIVLPVVIHINTLLFSKQLVKWVQRFSCMLLKFFSHYPCTPSGPGAFQLGILFKIFFILPLVIANLSCSGISSVSSFISSNHSAFLLCSLFSPQISLQNFVPAFLSGIYLGCL